LSPADQRNVLGSIISQEFKKADAALCHHGKPVKHIFVRPESLGRNPLQNLLAHISALQRFSISSAREVPAPVTSPGSISAFQLFQENADAEN
jgi:hypothetical protein